jgi:RHS repeat-associated protein
MDTADDVTLLESALGNPFLFTGREYDPETGLIYLRARYYDPSTGTFLQEDSFPRFLEDSQSLNRYSYVYNNPINATDPSGHFALVGTGIGLLEVLLVLLAAGAAYYLSRQQPVSFCPISFRNGEPSGATESGTEVGRKWKDLNDNPQDWEKVEDKPDPRQPRGGSSVRETWKNKKTGEKIGVHRKDPPVPGGKQHPHPFPVGD